MFEHQLTRTALLVILCTACAPQLATTRKPLSPCAHALVEHGYVPEDATAAADSLCTQYAAAQIDCAKREYDAQRNSPGVTFAVSATCTGATAPAEPAPVAAAPAPAPSAPVEAPPPPAPVQAAEAAAAPVAAPEPAKPAAPSGADVLAALSTQEDLSTFTSLLGEAGLTETIAQASSVTLLAPLNAALAKFPKLAANKDRLKKVMSVHVVMGPPVSAADAPVPPVKPVPLKTLGGKVFPLRATKAGVVRVGPRAKVVRPDLPASNGIIVVIDAVLMP